MGEAFSGIQSRLVCLREGVDLQRFSQVAMRDGIHRSLLLPLMGGVHCLCDEQGEQWLATHPDVERVEPDIPLSRTGIWARYQRRNPREVLPEGVRLIRAPEAWGVAQGSGVGIAIIDTGIDLQHPDLAPNIGAGANLVRSGASPQDLDGHGTFVAGIAGAVRNLRCMAGVAPKAQLHPVKVIGSDGNSALSDIIRALHWVVDERIPIANMSMGTPTHSLAFERTVQNAVARGLTLVAAAGNAGGSGVDFPAAFAGTIAVTAVDLKGQLAPFSNRGAEVAVAAPGVQIFSTWPGGHYARASGTSFAAPHVSGLAALFLSLHPGASPAQIREGLIRSAVPLEGALDGVGAGRIDAWNAVHQT